MYSSILSTPVSLAPSINFKLGSTKIDVLIPLFLNSQTTSFNKFLYLIVSQPAFEVIALIESGTSVTWVGLILQTRFTNLSIGFPSILNSFSTTLGNSIASL